MKKKNEGIVIYTRKIFSILLSILADVAEQGPIHNTISELAIQSGFPDSQALFSNITSVLLADFLEKKSFSLWSQGYKEKKKFEIIVRNSREGLGKFISEVLEIITQVTNPSHDVELRMDMMVLLEFILKQENLKETLISQANLIISQILAPAIVWRIGKTEGKFRKAAVINLVHLINEEIVSAEILTEKLSILLPSIKSCLTDSWNPDLRFVCCEFLEKMLNKLPLHLPSKLVVMKEEFFSDNYGMLLERLDDAKDEIRIKAAQALEKFFKGQNIQVSDSTFEYMVKNLLIHLDDSNEGLANEISQSLFALSSQPQYEILLKEGRAVQEKMKYPLRCKCLLERIQLSKESLD